MCFAKETIILSIVLSALQSCSLDIHSKYEVLRFLSKEITIPDNCLFVEQGDLHIATGLSRQGIARLFIIYTSKDCNECAVSHLDENNPLFSFANKDKRFETVVVMTPKDEAFEDIVDRLIRKSYKYPVYLDKEGSIEAQLSSNQLFHIFLLDKNNKVQFIGNPLGSVGSLKKFTRKLKRL